jgi:hypothetical protein
LILRYFDPRLPMVIKTDPNNFTIGATILQVETGYLKSGAFHLRKMDNIEINYKIYNKEMLAIIFAVKK